MNITAMPANLLTLPPLVAPDDAGQALRLRLDIYDESIIRTTFVDGQPAGYDELSPLDVARALADVAPAGGWLRENTVYIRPGHETRAAIYLSTAVRSLNIDGESHALRVPLPPLLFYGRGKKYHIYALAEAGWPTAKTALYHAPFPNVYPDGGICPGTVEFPACDPDAIHQAARLFFESAFNSDLDNGKSQAHPQNVIALWRKLAAADDKQYPINDLLPHNLTLEEVL